MNWKKVKDTRNSVKKTLEDSDDDEQEMVVTELKPKSKKAQKVPDSDDEE
jgi:hypothetical protein